LLLANAECDKKRRNFSGQTVAQTSPAAAGQPKQAGCLRYNIFYEF